MATLTVGTNQQYSTIEAAVAASQSGDTVAVNAGTYVNDFVTINHALTLQAMGGIASIVATQAPPNGKAIIDEGGSGVSVTISGFNLSGAAVADGNGAGIRYEGGSLTLINDTIHNNQDGLLGAPDPNGAITISQSTFSANGTGDGRTHNIYIGAIAQATIQNSTITAANVGHDIKSRAASTTITGNTITDGASGTASYEIDLPNGGKGVITGNVIEKGAGASNPIAITTGEEGNVYANSSLLVQGNTILNDNTAHAGTVVVNATTATAQVTGNNLYGWTTVASGPSANSGNTVLATEPALAGAAPPSAPAAPPPTPSTPPPVAPSAPATVSLGSGPDTLALSVAEDAWQGNAQFTVSVDGQQAGGVQTALALQSTGQTQAFNVLGSFGVGNHAVSVNFLNDAYGGNPSADRNLYVDGATINGVAIPGSTLAFYVGGARSVAFAQMTQGTPDTLDLHVSEDAFQGDAQFTVAINGQTLAGVYTATASHAAGATQDIAIAGNWGLGPKTVGITFINDAYGGSAASDRNLYVDQVTYDGQGAAGTPSGLNSNGVKSFATPGGATGLTLNLAEDAWQGNAQYAVAVDGRVLVQAGAVTALRGQGQSQAINLQAVLTPGTHDLTVSFLNDAYGGSPATDRNLYVTGVKVNGNALPGGTAALLSPGTAHFGITIPSS